MENKRVLALPGPHHRDRSGFLGGQHLGFQIFDHRNRLGSGLIYQLYVCLFLHKAQNLSSELEHTTHSDPILQVRVSVDLCRSAAKSQKNLKMHVCLSMVARFLLLSLFSR